MNELEEMRSRKERLLNYAYTSLKNDDKAGLDKACTKLLELSNGDKYVCDSVLCKDCPFDYEGTCPGSVFWWEERM